MSLLQILSRDAFRSLHVAILRDWLSGFTVFEERASLVFV